MEINDNYNSEEGNRTSMIIHKEMKIYHHKDQSNPLKER